MLQDLYPHVYHNEMAWKAPAPDDIALIFAPDRTIYCGLEGSMLTLPRMRDITDGEVQYAFSIDETAYYLVSAHPGETDAFRYLPSASLRAMTDGTSPALFAAAAGESLYRWYDSQKFCGRCGARMEKSTVERAMVCPSCGKTFYPRIMPAVIVGVKNGDKLLLTRYRTGFAYNALIAGFTEIGETAEQTVAREVMEEAGIRVKNIRYYASQPWGIANDLLLGYYCELDGDSTIRMDTQELKYAQWVRREDIELQPDDFSLTNDMMRRFKLGIEK